MVYTQNPKEAAKAPKMRFLKTPLAMNTNSL